MKKQQGKSPKKHSVFKGIQVVSKGMNKYLILARH